MRLDDLGGLRDALKVFARERARIEAKRRADSIAQEVQARLFR